MARPSSSLEPGSIKITAIKGADLSYEVDDNCAGIGARETLALFDGKIDCGVEIELIKVRRRSRGSEGLRPLVLVYCMVNVANFAVQQHSAS